jgi:hypothetical protein
LEKKIAKHPKPQNWKENPGTHHKYLAHPLFLNNANFLKFFVKSPMIFWGKNPKLGRKKKLICQIFIHGSTR